LHFSRILSTKIFHFADYLKQIMRKEKNHYSTNKDLGLDKGKN